MRRRPSAALAVALALAFPAHLAIPAAAWSFAAAAPAPRPLRILSATAGGPPSASFSATAAALCASPGITCVSVSPPGATEFNDVAAGLYDGVLAEVSRIGGEGRGPLNRPHGPRLPTS
jgi:hypothetical protein